MEVTWLLCLTSQPGQSGTQRMRLWRALKGSGAVVLRDGVYLLPCRDDLQNILLEQVNVVRAQGGSAFLLMAQTQSEEDNVAFRALFDHSSDYESLLETINRLQNELGALKEPQARRKLRRLQREFTGLQAIDYFPGAGLSEVEQALADAETALNRWFSPDEPSAVESGEVIEPRDFADFQNRIWATRKHLWVDRVASAWLIRRFIDPQARFIWLENPAACPPEAIGFDFDGALFSHVGERITFEVLLQSFALSNDPGLARLAALVHYLDVGGAAVAEAAGFEAILSGIRECSGDDDELLATMTPVLDALHINFNHQ